MRPVNAGGKTCSTAFRGFSRTSAMALVNLFAVSHPGSWLTGPTGEALGRFIYYGASVEFFFVIFTDLLV
jgi:hypothetical protein